MYIIILLLLLLLPPPPLPPLPLLLQGAGRARPYGGHIIKTKT